MPQIPPFNPGPSFHAPSGRDLRRDIVTLFAGNRRCDQFPQLFACKIPQIPTLTPEIIRAPEASSSTSRVRFGANSETIRRSIVHQGNLIDDLKRYSPTARKLTIDPKIQSS